MQRFSDAPVEEIREHNAINCCYFTLPLEIVRFSNPPPVKGERSDGRGPCKFGLHWHFTLPGLKADPPRGRVIFVENPSKKNRTICMGGSTL
jgi:hypothetical protein